MKYRGENESFFLELEKHGLASVELLHDMKITVKYVTSIRCSRGRGYHLRVVTQKGHRLITFTEIYFERNSKQRQRNMFQDNHEARKGCLWFTSCHKISKWLKWRGNLAINIRIVNYSCCVCTLYMAWEVYRIVYCTMVQHHKLRGVPDDSIKIQNEPRTYPPSQH